MKKIKQVMALLLMVSLPLIPVLSSTAYASEKDSYMAMNTMENSGQAQNSEENDNIVNASVSGSDAMSINKEILSISDSNTIIMENEIHRELSVSGSDALRRMEFPYLAATAYADQFDLDTYNESIYRAERYLATDSVSYKNVSSMMEIGIPSDIIVNLGKDDWGFMSSVAAWKVANMVVSPSQIAQGALDEIGYYEAIIFSIFIEQSKDENYLYRLINETNSETNKIISQIEKWIKETDALDQKVDVSTGMLKSMSEKDKEELKKELEIIFIKEHPWLDGVSEIGGMIKTVFDFSDTLIDAIETMTAYMQLYELPQEMKMVISYMYEKCPENNTYLKQALQEASDATGSLASAFSVSALHTVDELTVDVAGELIDDWWKSILAKNKYALAYSSGAKLGIFISNTLFSTDKTIEQFEKMVCLQEVYKLLKEVAISSGETFEHARTVENADVYIAAVDALYKIGELSCDFAMNFEEVYYTETIAALKLLWDNDSYENYMQKLRNIKSYYVDNKKTLTRSYLNDLEADYPELYAQLYGSHEEKYIAVEGIQFPQDEITIGTQDVYTCFEIPTISPSNATKQGVTYASSDTSILEVSGPVVMLTPHKPGTVTVTVTTEDGGYSDTILVHVVEGRVADFQNWGVPAVVDSGSCNGSSDDDTGYVLYENGLLVISGNGTVASNTYSWSDKRWEYLWEEEKVISVLVRDGVTSIGSDAFRGCSNLSSIQLPSGITSIGSGAFWDCRNLSSIELPSGLTNIGDCTFRNCENLSNIELPSGVTSIGNQAFEGCSNLLNIELPSGVTSIGSGAFWGCRSLLSIELPSGVTNIGSDTFFDCSSLLSIELPLGVTNIGSDAFRGCKNLLSLQLPPGVISIGYGAFWDCSSLSNIELPSGITSIKDYTFRHCSSLSSIELSSEVTSIGGWAFEGCNSLLSMKLPSGLTEIEVGVFKDCGNLSSVELPLGLTSIGDDAFRGCSNLPSIKLPSGLISIGSSTFSGCSGLSSMELPEGLTRIESDTFSGCSSLSSIKLPTGLTSIGSSAFWGCSSLSSIELPLGLTSIESDAFAGCSNLSSIELPSGLTNIESGTFRNCSGLESIELPLGLTGIGEQVFSFCYSLYDVYYKGTEEQWQEIQIEDNGNDALNSATIHFNSIGHKVETNVSSSDVDLEVSVSVTYKEQQELLTHILTAEELSAVEAGQKAIMELSVVNAEHMLSDADRQIVSTKASEEGCAIGRYLDITMSVQIGDGDKRAVTQTDLPIRIILGVPDELQQNGRVFSVMRIHDDEVDLLEDMDVNPGTVTIETDSFSSYVIVYKDDIIDNPSIAVTDIVLDRNTISMTDGETIKLNATIIPDNADNQNVIWSSDNAEIADVLGGTVTALKEGVATITATTEDGNKTATCSVMIICNHMISDVEAVLATCETDGSIEYYVCDKCGRKFSDESATKEITDADIVVKALGHNLEAGWKTNGESHWKICSACGQEVEAAAHDFKWIVDKPATEEYEGVGHEECICGIRRNENTTIPKLIHVHTGITHHDRISANCMNAGNIEYWTCSSPECAGKCYGDADCQIVLADIVVAIDPNNHVDDGKWVTTKEEHSWICLCGVTINTGLHVYDNKEDALCNVCGYRRFYQVTSGANGFYEQGAKRDYIIKVNGDYALFESVKIDGTILEAETYTVAAGSTVITLNKAYLDTLTVGTHTVEVVYMDGKTAETQFTIRAAKTENDSFITEQESENAESEASGMAGGDGSTVSDLKSPKTGQEERAGIWMLLIVIIVSGGAGTLLYLKKMRQS